ncbi:glycerate kinase [Brevibacillus marinus]|uniref:glycerate kinase n=1 Tax=Brevibacillus marinus TaxID=2496837 RepID=UPI000F83016F|nr:glycerate kinase [Brevibacillus marinus]
MKIVIAPDSFKGSLSAPQLCAHIRKGVLRACPSASVLEIPLADGGEGTMENIVHATNGTITDVVVRGPLGEPTKAAYGVLGDGQTVVIEMAQASGLPLLKEHEKNPLLATSYGTGELIRHALDAGYRRFIIGLGGSATNDGGAGMLRALGLRFLDSAGRPLAEGGAALAELACIDDAAWDQRISEASFLIASDVTNPLCGPSGASAVFGPQKGATPEMVARLDRALARFAEVVERQTGKAIRDVPGSGAAGGMGAALLAFMGAEMRPGIDLLLETVQFEQRIRDADLIITGEGRLDSQTLAGKVIAGVCRRAGQFAIPTVALCGGMELSAEQCDQLGLVAGFSLVPGPCTLEQAKEHAGVWSEERAEQLMRLVVSLTGASKRRGSD